MGFLPQLGFQGGRYLIEHRDGGQAQVAAMLLKPLAGVGIDESVEHKARMRGEPIEGRAWIKTGSLNDVRSIAGYVDAASGRRYAVVMLVNGPRAAGSAAAQDALLRWVHANG